MLREVGVLLLGHGAHIPSHVLDALHAMPQIAAQAVADADEREDGDHGSHRVCLVAAVEAGQPGTGRVETDQPRCCTLSGRV